MVICYCDNRKQTILVTNIFQAMAMIQNYNIPI